MKILYLLVIAILPFSVFSTESIVEAESLEENKQKIIKKIVVEGQHIYTSQIKLPDGNIAYFGSELIYNEERSNSWNNFRHHTSQLTQATRRGVIGSAVARLGDGKTSIETVEQWFNNCFPKNDIGEHNHKEEFIRNFRKYIAKGKTSPGPFDGIASGCIGLHTSLGDRINYVSRTPITGLFNFPSKKLDWMSIQDYMEHYGDIVMVVSSFPYSEDNNDTYEHRGIFRNPLSMLRGDYKGLALPLHSFAARTWVLEHPFTKLMYVRTDGNVHMYELLLKNFDDAEIIDKTTTALTINVEALMKKF